MSETDAPNATGPWLPVAELLRPQGRRGELLAELLSDIEGLLVPGVTVSLAKDEHAPGGTERVLEDVWSPKGKNAGRVVLKLAGVDSISDAEALTKLVLRVPAAEVPELPEDTYFVRELLGCGLFAADGTRLGEITDVEYLTGSDGRRIEEAAPLLAVRPDGAAKDAEPVLVPFVRKWLIGVALPARRVEMNVPEGLFGDIKTEPAAAGANDVAE